MIVGLSDLVLKLKSNFKEQFKWDNCVVLTEYMGTRLNASVKM
jgi:hypothetical protein